MAAPDGLRWLALTDTLALKQIAAQGEGDTGNPVAKLCHALITNANRVLCDHGITPGMSLPAAGVDAPVRNAHHARGDAILLWRLYRTGNMEGAIQLAYGVGCTGSTSLLMPDAMKGLRFDASAANKARSVKVRHRDAKIAARYQELMKAGMGYEKAGQDTAKEFGVSRHIVKRAVTKSNKR